MSQSFPEGGSPQEHHTEIHGEEQHLQDSNHLYHQGQLQTYIPADPSAVHTLSQLHRDAYENDPEIAKGLVGIEGFNSDLGHMEGGPPQEEEGSPERKRRRMNGEQQVKRHKYDVLKSFFRIYFKVDNQSMVLKDAIFNLYSRKIPADSRIARNAMYRHMWSFFKEDKISAFQSNYREYIKGIKLLTYQDPLAYDGFDKDLEVLHSISVRNLFDFQEEELAKNSSDSIIASPLPMTGLAPAPAGVHSPQDYLKTDSSDDDIFRSIEALEGQAKNITASIRDLKAKLLSRKK